MDLKKNINTLVRYIIESKKIEVKSNINHIINLHFAKIDFIVKVASREDAEKGIKKPVRRHPHLR